MDYLIRFMIVGAQKAATTSLFHYLAQHPDIHTHEQREIAYFLQDSEYGLGPQEGLAKYFGNAFGTEQVLIAKQALGMYSPRAIQRMHEHNRDMQLAIVLRNPIDRAYSAYWYALRRGWETAGTFEEALCRESERLAEGWNQNRQCMYVYHGMYSLHLRNIMEFFDRERVHVLLSGDLKQDIQRVCRQLFESIGIDARFSPRAEMHHNKAAEARSHVLARFVAAVLSPQSRVKAGIRLLIPDSLSYRLRHLVLRLNEKDFTPPPMKPETREHLRKVFTPYNNQLAEFLGRDLSAWNEQSA